jgi:vancomycin resistance protein YoaR
MDKKKISRLIHFLVPVVLFSPLVTLIAWGMASKGMVLRGISLVGIDISGKEFEKVEELVVRKFNTQLTGVSLQYEGREWQIDLASASAQINMERTMERVRETSSSTTIWGLLKKQWWYVRNPVDLGLEVDWDAVMVGSLVGQIASEIDTPYIPTEIELVTGAGGEREAVVKRGRIGKSVRVVVTVGKIKRQVERWRVDEPVVLVVEEIGELPTEEEEGRIGELANKLIGKRLVIKSDEGIDDLLVDDEVLISWLKIGGEIDPVKIGAFLNQAATGIEREAVDASFRFEGGKVMEFRAAKDGLMIEKERSGEEIRAGVERLAENGMEEEVVNLVLVRTEPAIKTEEVNNMGIKELLGSGKSSFVHSSTSRVHNVEKGSSVVNGVLVAPGEIFSFNKTIGEVSQATGYTSAYVIRSGRTELGDGGGVCQVSTTLFRAILDAGLPVTERQWHSFRVGYYEEDSDPGFDATVYSPSPDLKFKNDTEHYVLIQNSFDGVNRRLVYEIYGTSDGRITEISNYRKWGWAPPPPDLYIDDPTLPVGTVKKMETAVAGLKTAFDWKVVRRDEVLHEKTFSSYYQPWQAVYLKGTKQP